MHAMRAMLPLAALCVCLGACATTPAKPFTAIDQADFVNTAGDRLRLGLRGAYTIYWNKPPGTPQNQRESTGHWDLLSAEYQVITLDGKTPVRLSYRPNAQQAWEYRPIMLTGWSSILPAQRDQYVLLTGQYSAVKADLVGAPDEQSLTEMLVPAARGAR